MLFQDCIVKLAVAHPTTLYQFLMQSTYLQAAQHIRGLIQRSIISHDRSPHLGRSLGQPLYKDDFLYWSISEGDAPFGTDMPPFKNDLSDRDVWRILAFMRASFAEQSGPVADDAAAAP